MNTTSTPVRSNQAQEGTRKEIATFGAVHLDVTNLDRSVEFWQAYIGLQVRSATTTSAELGTESNTLVVLNATAKTPFKNGYSGIYHLAIHPANEEEFARVLARLISKQYPIAPTDHTMSKALYMEDPDGITVEITLETPERLARLEFGPRGPVAIDTDGTVRAASAALDVAAVLKALPGHDLTRPLADDTKVGHVHLYVSDVEAAHRFYKGLGFLDNMYLPQYGMADLGAGGAFGHRIAVNAGHTRGRPQAPEGTAGLRYYTIRFDTPERLNTALQSVSSAQERADGFLVTDPAGNKVLLTASWEERPESTLTPPRRT
ncbi:VOC family protein [Deinococcus sonorensis]|uniref:VOC family protein n=1 Tax=Deinococcus sonorensis TaxID=309891 RepID=A0ABV8Y9Z2_9DEIO